MVLQRFGAGTAASFPAADSAIVAPGRWALLVYKCLVAAGRDVPHNGFRRSVQAPALVAEHLSVPGAPAAVAVFAGAAAVTPVY